MVWFAKGCWRSIDSRLQDSCEAAHQSANKTERPPLYKVILLNDDYTPREFVVQVLKAVFRMNEDQAYQVMMTAHQKGACVIAVYVRDVAETKAKEATDLGKQNGFPLFFTTEPNNKPVGLQTPLCRAATIGSADNPRRAGLRNSDRWRRRTALKCVFLSRNPPP